MLDKTDTCQRMSYTHIYILYFPSHTYSLRSSRQKSIYLPPLEILVPRPTDNDIIDLEDHAAELGSEHELLALADEGVDDEGVAHVVVAAAHAVDAEAAARVVALDLLRLDLGQRGDRVEAAVLRQRHGHRVQGLGERPHRVLLEPGRLDRRVLDRKRAGDLGRAPAVHHPVVAHQVAHHAEGVVEGAAGFVDDLLYVVRLAIVHLYICIYMCVCVCIKGR